MPFIAWKKKTNKLPLVNKPFLSAFMRKCADKETVLTNQQSVEILQKRNSAILIQQFQNFITCNCFMKIWQEDLGGSYDNTVPQNETGAHKIPCNISYQTTCQKRWQNLLNNISQWQRITDSACGGYVLTK